MKSEEKRKFHRIRTVSKRGGDFRALRMAKFTSDVFVYSSLCDKKFWDSKSDKQPILSLVSASQKVGFLFSGDSGRFHLCNRRIKRWRHLAGVAFYRSSRPS